MFYDGEFFAFLRIRRVDGGSVCFIVLSQNKTNLSYIFSDLNSQSLTSSLCLYNDAYVYYCTFSFMKLVSKPA